MAFWASPLPSGLATTTGRIEFVSLRTDCSLPVALHLPFQERSYFQLIGSDQPMQGLAPCQSNTFTGAHVSPSGLNRLSVCCPVAYALVVIHKFLADAAER